MFFQPTDWCVKFWTNWLVLQFFIEIVFQLTNFLKQKSRSEQQTFFGGAWALIWDSYQTKLQQNVTENPVLGVQWNFPFFFVEKNLLPADQGRGKLKRFISWTLVAPFGGYWMGFPPMCSPSFCFGCLLEWRILWRWECFCKWLNTDMCNWNRLGVLLCTLSNVNINPNIIQTS